MNHADTSAMHSGFVRSRTSGLIVPASVAAPPRPPIGVDLFAGAGGMSLGFHQAGIHVAAAVENNVWAAMTYMSNLARYGECTIHFENEKRMEAFNRAIEEESERMTKANEDVATIPTMGSGHIRSHPEMHGCEHFFMWDARALSGAQILEALELGPGDVDIVAGGPPCQGFSTAGKRNVMDPRNSLVFEFARLVLEIAPKSMCMENVPGILSMRTPEGLPVVDVMASILEEGGWSHIEAVKRMLGADGRGAVLRSTGNRNTAPKEKTDERQHTLF